MAGIRIVPAVKRPGTLFTNVRVGMVGDQEIVEYVVAGEWRTLARITLDDIEQVALRDELIARHPLPVAPPPAPTPTPEPEPQPDPAPVPSPSSFEAGVVAGSALMYELGFVRQLGARTARLEFDISTPAAQMASTIDAYARAGVRPLLLAGFHRRLPSDTEARNVASWAAAFGPNGTFWTGKSYPADVAVTHIEFGNETSYSYQWSDNSAAAYAARAVTYGQRFAAAAAAITAVNPQVGLLAIGDGMNPTAWVTSALKGDPQLAAHAAGFTVHPYGNGWRSRIENTIAALDAANLADTVPLWITEWGLASDNGRLLSDNYGWNKAMSYTEAAATLRQTLASMRATYGERLAAFFVYQAHDLSATGTETGRERYFGALKLDGGAKGEYTTAVRELLAAG